MARGQNFDDFLNEELADEPQLADEVHDEFDAMRLGVELARCREAVRLTQLQLSIQSGVSQPMISRIERGDQQPTWPTIRRMLAVLRARMILEPDGSVQVKATSDGEAGQQTEPLFRTPA